MIVRKVTASDAEAFRDCRLAALRDEPTSFLSSYEEEEPRTVEMVRERFVAQRPENATFGAFDAEKIAGIIAIFHEPRSKRLHKMNIVSVYVRPEYRGRKIGHALMEAAIAHARCIPGVERIELGVRADNSAAKALYLAHGFVTWGREPEFLQYDGQRYDEDHMSLQL